jgi:hypothetical protein
MGSMHPASPALEWAMIGTMLLGSSAILSGAVIALWRNRSRATTHSDV